VVSLVRLAGLEAPNPVRAGVAAGVLNLELPEGRYAAGKPVSSSSALLSLQVLEGP